MNELSNIFTATTQNQNLTVSNILILLLVSVILGGFISLIYMFTHRKEGYQSDFMITLIMLPCIISIIIMLVGNSVASAFSLAGAFSLIRFRSAVGNPKDIAYVFFTVAVGLACGMGYILYSVMFAVFLCLIMIILDVSKFGQNKGQAMTLKITVPENLNFPNLFDDVLNKYTKSWTLKRVKTSEFGALFEVVFNIKFIENMNHKDFIDELRCLNGNLNIVLSVAETENAAYVQ